ncbi:hypothetical protein A5652_20865 [Mycobacterium sp. 1165178.9]|nr:hypothetical protein A5652_20865 [Mycobacterium sp. 1165178.9]
MSELAKVPARRAVRSADRGRPADGAAVSNRRGNRSPRDERRGQLLIVASDVFVDRGSVCRPAAVSRSDGAPRRHLGEFAHRFLI